MSKTVTITYLDDRLSESVGESDCVDLVETFIAEDVLDLRSRHIRGLHVAVAQTATDPRVA